MCKLVYHDCDDLGQMPARAISKLGERKGKSGLLGRQEGHPACKKPWVVVGGAVSPVGVAPTRAVGTSASIIFPCSIKIQKTRGGETQPERSTAIC